MKFFNLAEAAEQLSTLDEISLIVEAEGSLDENLLSGTNKICKQKMIQGCFL